MAGGGGTLGSQPKQKRGKTNRKPKKRIGFHLDMTPLVDITFLLLTFFMFTTTMLKPQMMEMKVPPEQDEDVEVAESTLMSLLVSDEGEIWWYMGTEEAEQIEMNEISKVAIEQNLKPGLKNELITVLKVSGKTKYKKLIEVLDELNLSETEIIQEVVKDTDPETGLPMKRKRKFTIADFTDEDRAKIDPNFQLPAEAEEGEKEE